ncbi:MAG TPA: hypothetical protein VFQ95_03550 [Rhodanobacteraceae bacterium]|nr:hypothetical protein [Rhodanobacteraceae bacterium]
MTMNIQKLVIIAIAIAINVVVLASFHAWSTAVVASAVQLQPTRPVVTLPVINVHPSAAQLRELRREGVAPAQTRAIRVPRPVATGSV